MKKRFFFVLAQYLLANRAIMNQERVALLLKFWY